MINLAVMPIYGKTRKIFFSGTKRPMTLKLGMQHRVLDYYQVCSMMNLGWPWPILRQGQIWSLMLLYGKMVKQWIFQKLFKYMMSKLVQWCQSWYMQSTKLLNETLWISKDEVIHWPLSNVIHIQHFQTFFPQRTLGRLEPYFMWSLHGMEEWKWIQTVYVTWPRWPPRSYTRAISEVM